MKIGKVLKIKEILDDNSFILIYLKDDDITICVDSQGFSFTDKNLIIDGELTKNKKVSCHVNIEKIKPYNFEPTQLEDNPNLVEKIYKAYYL